MANFIRVLGLGTATFTIVIPRTGMKLGIVEFIKVKIVRVLGFGTAILRYQYRGTGQFGL